MYFFSNSQVDAWQWIIGVKWKDIWNLEIMGTGIKHEDR